MDKVKTFIFSLLFENGEASLTRCLIAASFLLFICVSVYLLLSGVKWQDYNTFATITGGGSIGAKIADRVTTIVSGAPKGEMPGQKNGGN